MNNEEYDAIQAIKTMKEVTDDLHDYRCLISDKKLLKKYIEAHTQLEEAIKKIKERGVE